VAHQSGPPPGSTSTTPRWRAWLERVDPGLLATRRAPKAALVITGGLAIGLGVVGNERFALLWAFGGVAALLFARVWGEIAQRIATYAVVIVAGALVIVAGSVAGGASVGVAVASMVMVAFAVRYLGCVGGQVAGAAPAILLAFTLALLTSQGPDALGAEVAGWVVGTTLAALMDTLVWPAWPRRWVRADLRSGCVDVAQRLRALGAVSPPGGAATGGDGTPGAPGTGGEPAGLQGRIDVLARAMAVDSGHFGFAMSMADQLGELDDIVAGLTHPTGSVVPGGGGDPVGECTAEVLGRAADALDDVAVVLAERHPGRSGRRADRPGPGNAPWATARLAGTLAALNAASDRHRQALLAWTAQAHRPPAGIRDVASVSLSVRLVAVLVVSVGANLAAYSGTPLDPAAFTVAPAVSSRARLPTARQVAGVLRINWRWSSAWMRNALRTAIALGAAVVVTNLVEFPHSFWVVLATLTVLRTSAIDTGLTVAAVAVGIAVGFVVSYGLAVLASGHPWLLWVVLPVAIMGAVLAPVVVGVAGGQALFAVTVVALFNLVNDQGTLTAIQRIEAVALGMAVALVVAIALWPRGPRPLLAAALARLYGLGAGAATASLRGYVGAPQDPGVTGTPGPGGAATTSTAVADGALDDAGMLATEALIDVIDQGHLELGPRDYAPLFSLVALVQVLNRVEDGMWGRLGVTPHPIGGEVGGVAVQAWPDHLGAHMEAISALFAVAVHPHWRPPVQGSPVAATRGLPPAGSGPPQSPTGELVAGWVAAWLHLLAARLRRAEEASAVVATALARPWWR